MQKLKLLPMKEYVGVNREDPIRFYYWPVIGRYYCQRVELCLNECSGGRRILEIGFGTGLTFLNLREVYQEIHGLDLTADIDQVAQKFKEKGVQVTLKRGNVLDMPYPDEYFDTVLLISILEHLQPKDLLDACLEIKRVLRPGGQVVIGVPVERPMMAALFRLMGVDIREHHFSTDIEIIRAAQKVLHTTRLINLPAPMGLGAVYKIGHFQKAPASIS